MVRNIPALLGSVVRRGRDDGAPAPSRETCLIDGASLVDSQLYQQHHVCPLCRFHYSMRARERIDSLADPGSFREANRSIVSLDPLSFSSRMPYKQRIFRDQRRTGLTEAAITGTCTIGGSPAMLIVLDFGFMGGTIGCVVGEKVALALERAVKRNLPTVAVITSGGARIQEGVLSLMQMAKTTIVANKINEKGLPIVSILANPATGQAYANFASLADIVLAEPDAIIGYSPIRAIKKTGGSPSPREAHTAESHLENGMIDAVVDRTEMRNIVGTLLDLLGPQYLLTPADKSRTREAEAERPEAWRSVQLARHESRPTAIDYIKSMFTNFVELHGDRCYGDDKSIVCGFGHLGGQTVTIIGQERGRGSSGDHNDGRTSPEGFRKAQRALRLASKFSLPLVTLIDTPGPNLSTDAETRGLGNAIASTMSMIASLEVPSISVVIGEGGSGGALALGVTDRVMMMENAIYSPISPEEAAEVMYQDEARAQEAAASLKLTARDCRERGIVDLVVSEPPGGAHTNPDEASRALRRALLQELATLQSGSRRRMLQRRYKKFRKMGEYSSHFRAAVTREVATLQGRMKHIVRRRSRTAIENGDLDDLMATLPEQPSTG